MEEFRGSVSRGCHHGQVSGEAVARTSSSWKAMKFIHVVRAMSPAVKKCIEFGIAQCFSNSLSLWPPFFHFFFLFHKIIPTFPEYTLGEI